MFKEGGYAIFRSSWSDADTKATWILLNAASHSNAHKHSDDLEVLLYRNGPLFVEAGNRNYDYRDRKTMYTYSGYAHNVLLVDGEAYPVKFGKLGNPIIFPEALETRITSFSLENQHPSVTAIQRRFPGIEQARTVFYDKDLNEIRIEDLIRSERAFNGTLLWHVAEGVDVKQHETRWEFWRFGQMIAGAEILGNTIYELETITGSGSYPYVTWIFNGKNEPSYGTLLKVNFEGKAGITRLTMRVS